MKKWLKIGAALLLVAWAPFIYAELTSSPAEKKARELPSIESDEAHVEAEPIEPGTGALAGKPAAAPAEAPAAAEPQAEAEPAPEPEAVEEPAAPVEPVEAPAEDEALAADEEAEEDEAPPPVASGPTAQLKQAFETEPRDALWASDAERRITAVWSGDEVPEGMLQRVSCRRVVCRADVQWQRDHVAQYVGAYEALRDQFGAEIAVEPEGAVDDEGRQTVHLYVLRKGYTAADLAH